MAKIEKKSSLWSNRKCFIICCAVSVANLQAGLDQSIVSGLQAMPGFLRVFGHADPNNPIGYGIEPSFQQLITSLMTLGSFFSSILAGGFARYFGRKTAIWAACVLNLVACTMLILTTSRGAVYAGRLLLGFAVGFLVTFSNVYVSEIAPARLRGVLVGLFGSYISLGSILGAAINNATSKRLDKLSYQIPTACLYFVPILLSVCLFFIPESPRYLLHHGKDFQAKESLIKIRGELSNEEIDLEFEWAQMVRGIAEERLAAVSGMDWTEMFKGTNLRRTLLCLGTISTQSASGVWFLVAYQTYFLQQAGVAKAFELSIMTSCVGFVGVLLGLYGQHHWYGRRSIMIFGAAAVAISQLIPAVVATTSNDLAMRAQVLTAFIALVKFFFFLGNGSVCYPVATELVNTRLRAWTVGAATGLNFLLSWLISFCSPYFINPAELNWGEKYGYIWFGGNMFCVFFFYFFIPEMKGRSLEELDEMFRNRVSVDKFPTYQCVLPVEIQENLSLPNDDTKAEVTHMEEKV